MTTYRARNTLTGQTFLPRLFMTHAMQDYIDQPILSNWTVDLIETPKPSKSFESVFPDATESLEAPSYTDQSLNWEDEMLWRELSEDHKFQSHCEALANPKEDDK